MKDLKSERTGLTGLFCESARDADHQKELIAYMKDTLKEAFSCPACGEETDINDEWKHRICNKCDHKWEA